MVIRHAVKMAQFYPLILDISNDLVTEHILDQILEIIWQMVDGLYKLSNDLVSLVVYIIQLLVCMSVNRGRYNHQKNKIRLEKNR